MAGGGPGGGHPTGYPAISKMTGDPEGGVCASAPHTVCGRRTQPDHCRALDLLRAVKQALDHCRRPPVVRWQGKALPVVGRIGTQYTLVDASGTELKPGDMVTAEVDMLFPNPHRNYI